MKESGTLDNLQNKTAVFGKNETKDFVKKDVVQNNLIQNSENDRDGKKNKLDNATIVDSRGSNQISQLAEASDAEIVKTVTSKKLMKSSSYFIESRLERDKKE